MAFITASDADRGLDILRSHPLGDGSCLIGKVKDDSSPAVVMRSRIGATRIVDMFSGEQLPRIPVRMRTNTLFYGERAAEKPGS